MICLLISIWDEVIEINQIILLYTTSFFEKCTIYCNNIQIEINFHSCNRVKFSRYSVWMISSSLMFSCMLSYIMLYFLLTFQLRDKSLPLEANVYSCWKNSQRHNNIFIETKWRKCFYLPMRRIEMIWGWDFFEKLTYSKS